MKKSIYIILVIIITLIVVFLIYRFSQSHNGNNPNTASNYNAIRTGTESNNLNENTSDENTLEQELFTFSTPIKSNDKNRTTNLKITCSRINETIVNSGKEFSFCDVVGQPNSADGYKPADAFGSDGEIIKAIGGGNCQVSTTIYNAILGVTGLEVTERHEHDRDVAYIEDGKDATVAYDYLDLKFKNNNNFDIKLYASVSNNKVIVKIVKI